MPTATPGPALSNMGTSGTTPAGITGGSMPGQQLNYGNMIYNGNNANQQGMNALANAQGFNQDQFNQIYNPYVSDVANNAATLAQQQFQQNTVPQLQSQFVGGGQAGSARAMGTMQQAANQNDQNILMQQAGLLNTGFQQAMQNYQGLQNNSINAGNSLVDAGAQANNQAMQQAMLPANQAAVYSGALGGLKTPTFSGSSSSQQSPYYFSGIA